MASVTCGSGADLNETSVHRKALHVLGVMLWNLMVCLCSPRSWSSEPPTAASPHWGCTELFPSRSPPDLWRSAAWGHSPGRTSAGPHFPAPKHKSCWLNWRHSSQTRCLCCRTLWSDKMKEKIQHWRRSSEQNVSSDFEKIGSVTIVMLRLMLVSCDNCKFKRCSLTNLSHASVMLKEKRKRLNRSHFC